MESIESKIEQIIEKNIRLNHDGGNSWTTGEDDAALEIAELFPKWISVEDRLPDDNQSVIICNKYNTITLGWYGGHDFWNKYDVSVIATHWQPLPDAPILTLEK